MNFNNKEWSPILTFWFGSAAHREQVTASQMQRWFKKNNDTDQKIASKFGPWVERALAGSLSHWEAHPEGSLAKILLLDQFTRNQFRGTPKAFAGDSLAKCLAERMMKTGQTDRLPSVMKVFCYLPFEHSENLEDQNTAVLHFEKLVAEVSAEYLAAYENFLDYAIRHRAVILRFGRFPHRNEILGRVSSPEETKFLEQPGSRF